MRRILARRPALTPPSPPPPLPTLIKTSQQRLHLHPTTTATIMSHRQHPGNVDAHVRFMLRHLEDMIGMRREGKLMPIPKTHYTHFHHTA
jgi:hypothetical protein